MVRSGADPASAQRELAAVLDDSVRRSGGLGVLRALSLEGPWCPHRPASARRRNDRDEALRRSGGASRPVAPESVLVGPRAIPQVSTTVRAAIRHAVAQRRALRPGTPTDVRARTISSGYRS